MAVTEEDLMAFVGRAVGDFGSLLTGALVVLGDQTGLLEALAGAGSVTPAELAAASGCNERYVREWLSGLAAADYVSYDGDGRWSLRPERGSDEVLATYGWGDLRFSVSWKAYCFADEDERAAWHTHADDLSFDRILDRLRTDLDDRDVLAADAPIAERDLAVLLIDTYEHYPAPTA